MTLANYSTPPTRYSAAEQIERHLIARVLPAAYTPRPGRPPPRYNEAQASQALTLRMNQDHTRDLAWWHVPRWASTMLRIFTTGLAHGLKHGLGLGLVLVGLVLALGAPVLVDGLTIGFTIGIGIGLWIGFLGGPGWRLWAGSWASYVGETRGRR